MNLPRCFASLLRVIASRLVAVPGAASALRPRTCRPRPIWLLPSSATGGGRRPQCLVAVPGAASALRPRTCRPRPIFALPSSATGGGRAQLHQLRSSVSSRIWSEGIHFSLNSKKEAHQMVCFFFELRGEDLNLRPPGYEPDELPDCSTPR